MDEKLTHGKRRQKTRVGLCLFVWRTDPWEKKTMGKGGEFGGSAAEEPERKQI